MSYGNTISGREPILHLDFLPQNTPPFFVMTKAFVYAFQGPKKRQEAWPVRPHHSRRKLRFPVCGQSLLLGQNQEAPSARG